MLDIETIQQFRRVIRKKLEDVKEDICYSIDTIEKLQYAKGKLSAYEALLRDLNDLLKKENDLDDFNKT